MRNPFDAADGSFLALVNASGQWSLWPADLSVPAGWDVSFGPAARTECITHVESRWVDLRPVAASGSQG
ncbi:MAG: MbtH family protein [Actinobacteria bacterium]|nr:MbtH family protein [Actinomycetota bacterium]